jgi:hypothetical protein
MLQIFPNMSFSFKPHEFTTLKTEKMVKTENNR